MVVIGQNNERERELEWVDSITVSLAMMSIITAGDGLSPPARLYSMSDCAFAMIFSVIQLGRW